MSSMVITMVEHYGYIAVLLSMLIGIIGLPVPDEFLLFFVGSMTASAKMNLYVLIGVAWLGSSIGMTVNYFLGRKIGIRRISKITKWIHLNEDRLTKWASKFQKFGPGLILIGFFVAGLRHASPFIAGASGISYKRYACFAYGGALIWICTFVFLGNRLGNHWQQLTHILHHPWWIIIIIAVITSLYLVKKYRAKFLFNV